MKGVAGNHQAVMVFLKEAQHSHHSMEGSRYSQKSLGFILSLLFAANRGKAKELNLKITKQNAVIAV